MFCTKVLVTISVENGPMARFLNCMALPILISLSIVTISWHIRRALSSSCCFLTRIASFRINSSTPDTLPLAARGIRRINTLFRTSRGLRVAVFVSGNGSFCISCRSLVVRVGQELAGYHRCWIWRYRDSRRHRTASHRLKQDISSSTRY